MDVLYEYGSKDVPQNQRGRVTKVTHQGGCGHWYRRLGEVIKELKTVHVPPERFASGSKFNQGAKSSRCPRRSTTDTFGRLYTLIYPDGEMLHPGTSTSSAVMDW